MGAFFGLMVCVCVVFVCVCVSVVEVGWESGFNRTVSEVAGLGLSLV